MSSVQPNSTPERTTRDTNGIQSVDIAMKVLRVMLDAREPLSLKEYSARSRMAPSKLHRYLHSLVEAGLLAQPRRAGLYELGPFALETGLAALQRVEQFNHTADRMTEFAEETGVSTCLSVWSNVGPTIIRCHKVIHSVTTAFGVGDVLPLLTSATGNVFLAYLPRTQTARLVEREQAEVSAEGRPYDVDEIIARVRQQRHAVVEGHYVGRIMGTAAPVFNLQKEISAVVGVVTGHLGAEAKSALSERLLRLARISSFQRPDVSAAE